MSMVSLRLDSEALEPLYVQLYDYLKSQIMNGGYPYNTKLPSKRQLSSYLQCSQNTIQAAYGQLMAEGYIISKPRSGYYVCKIDRIVTIKKEVSVLDQRTHPKALYAYDFSYHGVDFHSFPFTAWRKITKDVIDEYDLELLKKGNVQGDENLRLGIANYLCHSRGVKCSSNQIIISSGTEFLLQLLIQLFDTDYVFAIENPGYEKLNMIFKSNHALYKAIPLDSNGMLLDELVKNHINVACVTPSHQFPTGNIMPVNRRMHLLNWSSQAADRYIIEDDYDSEFKYSGRPIPSLQGLDTSEKVIYMGAFSKSLTPSIRISYMVLPKALLETYHKKLSFYLCPVPIIEQKVLFRFINEGYFERHLNRMRNIYGRKRETLVAAIHTLLPNAEIEGANAGLHLILQVKNGMSEEELILSAKEKNVKVYGLSQYYFDSVPEENKPSVLLGFATMEISEIFDAITLLSKAWN